MDQYIHSMYVECYRRLDIDLLSLMLILLGKVKWTDVLTGFISSVKMFDWTDVWSVYWSVLVSLSVTVFSVCHTCYYLSSFNCLLSVATLIESKSCPACSWPVTSCSSTGHWFGVSFIHEDLNSYYWLAWWANVLRHVLLYFSVQYRRSRL